MNSAPTVHLGEVASLVRGITFKPDDVVPVGSDGSVACLRTKNVQSELDLSDVWGIPASFVKREDQYLLRGDLLVSSANSWNLVGKCCWVPDLQWAATFGGFISVLRGNPSRIEPRYLYHWFSSPRIQSRVRSFGQQTTNISNLNFERCMRLPLPLPPLPEQRRIAEILDKAGALHAKRYAALVQLDTLTRSVFHELFLNALDGPAVDIAKDRIGVPEGWSWELLTDVARLATGHTPDRERKDYWGGDIPWISLTDIRELDTRITMQTLQNVTALGIENSSSVRLPAGTVCFSRTASVGFVTVMGREMATSQDFVNWVCGPRVTSMYLMWALVDARRRLRALSSGSTHKTIYMRVVERFRVLVPPMELQRKFSDRVERIDGLKGLFRRAVVRLDSLTSSLQYRAFGGQL